MYRNSAQLKCIKSIVPNALPSPDNTSDSDSEILDALDQKRRQLDEEVARFKAAKDREFREFEKQLWVNKKRSRAGANSASQGTPTKPSSAPSAATSALSLLASTRNGAVNGWPGYKTRRDGAGGDKVVRKPPPLSGPTLSLEKLNIAGETTPPLHTLGTPPTPTILARTRPRSPTIAPTTPPPAQSKGDPPAVSTPTPSKDRSDPFAGVFTPMYLPLLESRDRKPIVRSPQPLSAEEEEAKRLQLDAESKERADQVLEKQARSSQSLPPQPVSPTVVATKRTQSTSVLPSASLPSALRSASGGGRRRKHVMFQLADLKVVDPSSSYEEGPSPELEAEKDVSSEAQQESLGVGQHIEEVNGGRDRGSPGLLGAKERRRGRGPRGRFISPIPSPLASPNPSPSPSPALNGSPPSSSPLQSPRLISSPDESGFSGGLVGAVDGGSGVGFFELDEELASPALREGRPAESFDLEIEEEISEKIGRDSVEVREQGLGIIPSVQVGSVPIDIVRPSGSWVGSFGH
ncbi:hypothetical protein AYL99_07502 [Fonsecaea erecta]|uniref:Uncharacterized protein n=1 Tax=Fonsecaea erecta TaxID=1367422 RepID=A0A178ZFJ5_9EURO|nr:hypothetical protein AYL99_07502 [Fonsecaea erecta]OAP58412.1 hypothetical protein AYL99_07502 [Fonsecaea erecta]